MPIGGGLRRVEDEKQLLSELSKLFHVVKAAHKEQRNVNAAAATTTTTGASVSSSSPSPNPQGAANTVSAGDKRKPNTGAAQKAKSVGVKGSAKRSSTARRGSQRRSKAGGTVWVVLKGGFASSAVPSAAQSSQVTSKAKTRADRVHKNRIAALENAEAYVKSAWQQAEEAGLLLDDGKTPNPDGETYLREQYAEAVKLLQKPAPGAYLRQLVATHSTSASTESKAAAVKAVQPQSSAQSVKEWEGIISRERAILSRAATFSVNTGASKNSNEEEESEAVRAAIEEAQSACYSALAEPCVGGTSTGAAPQADIVPTKCIVRIRNSQCQKHTAILSTPKAINYFRSNFAQVMRKELSSSKLPRGAVEDVNEGEGRAGTHSPPAQSSHKQQTQQGGGGHQKGQQQRKKRR